MGGLEDSAVTCFARDNFTYDPFQWKECSVFVERRAGLILEFGSKSFRIGRPPKVAIVDDRHEASDLGAVGGVRRVK